MHKYLTIVNQSHPIEDADVASQFELVQTQDVNGKNVLVEKQTLQAYQNLHDFCQQQGITIGLDSAHRSKAYQQKLMDDFATRYGEEYAKKTVAKPGTSEHHTGLGIDLTLKIDGKWLEENDDLLKQREIFKVIHDNLAQFGFILRYPLNKENITGYPYEPWHIRYVGVEPAQEIASRGITLEEYLSE